MYTVSVSKKSRNFAYLALLGNTVLWGLALPIVKKGYDFGLTPELFLTARMFLAALLSLPIFLLYRRDKSFTSAFKPKSLLKIIPLEFLGTVATLFLLYQGLQLTTAIDSTLITMTAPLFVVIGGIFFLRETEERHEWLGLFLALFGTMLLVIRPLLNGVINGDLTGNLYLLGQNTTLAIYYLLAKKHYHKLNKFAVTHLSFWIGGFGFLLIGGQSPLTIISEISNLTFWPLLAIVYMATFGSIIALTLYLIGQDRIEASEASLFAYLQPVIAIPASIILLSETISIVEIIATAIIILGVYLAEKRTK